MALDFALEIDSPLTAEEVMKIILQQDGFEKNGGETDFLAEGLVGGVRASQGEDYYAKVHQEIMQENFGFVPSLRIWYRPDGYDGYAAGMQNGLKIFMSLLQLNVGDAACVMNGESVKFTRIKGKLVLNQESFGDQQNSIWSLRDVPFPDYQLKKFDLLE
jgi:hypothetical protein